MVRVNTEECVVCGGCIDLCPEIAIRMIDDLVTIDEEKCISCKICVKVCPVGAPFVTEESGE